jgi:uncharacterized protein RhaS with RHS repeats
LYYFGARYYDPEVGRFIGVDPLSEEYPGWSPYVYCLNNPLKNIDPDGRDVIVLNDEDGAYGFGHNAVVVGNDDDGWTYYSYDGDGNYTTKNFESHSDFTKSDVAKRYNRTVRFTTTKKQDANANKQGQKEVKVKRDGSVKQILTNNCAHLVENVAGEGEIKLPNRTIPNKQYDDAVKEKKRREEAQRRAEEKRKKQEENKNH